MLEEEGRGGRRQDSTAQASYRRVRHAGLAGRGRKQPTTLVVPRNNEP